MIAQRAVTATTEATTAGTRAAADQTAAPAATGPGPGAKPVAALRRDEPEATRTRRSPSGVSVRVRITAAFALLLALALAGAGLIVYLVESQRVADRTQASVEQEFAELAALQRSNHTNNRPYDDVGQLLTVFLRRNVPEAGEVLLIWYDGGTREFFLPRSAEALVENAELQRRLPSLVSDNGTARFTQDGQDLQVDAQTVSTRGGRESGALVVITNLTRARSGLLGTMRTYAVVSLLSLIGLTAVAGWQSGRLLAPLRTLRETAEEISESDLSRRIAPRRAGWGGEDDVGALTRTVNGMLDRLEAAFVGQRRFLDDAGHELRTPLTVLQGHLELLDTGSPDEVAQTRALLLDELDRMARLVGDLILLAKSDRPDFVVPEETDLGSLTEDVLAKARALAEREWRLDAVAEGPAVIDGQRVTQALLQLADNAVKHTGHGDQIGVGSAVGDGTVRLWVRDTGPGVPAPDRELVFERFGRSTVPSGDEGFGLGLSIVRAIAVAHGGSVTVTDARPGHDRPGARFEVVLPRRPYGDHQPPQSSGQRPGTQEQPWPGS